MYTLSDWMYSPFFLLFSHDDKNGQTHNPETGETRRGVLCSITARRGTSRHGSDQEIRNEEGAMAPRSLIAASRNWGSVFRLSQPPILQWPSSAHVRSLARLPCLLHALSALRDSRRSQGRYGTSNEILKKHRAACSQNAS